MIAGSKASGGTDAAGSFESLRAARGDEAGSEKSSEWSWWSSMVAGSKSDEKSGCGSVDELERLSEGVEIVAGAVVVAVVVAVDARGGSEARNGSRLGSAFELGGAAGSAETEWAKASSRPGSGSGTLAAIPPGAIRRS